MAVYTDTGGATITTMIPSYYNKIWVERLEATLVFDKYGVKADIPRGEGGSIIWHALKSIGQGYTLNETVAAGTSAVSTRKVSAVPVWKAQLVDVTTRVEATAVNNVVKEVVAEMGYSAALTKDSDIADQIGFGSACSTGVANAASVTLPSIYTQGFPIYEGNTDTCYWAVKALQNGLFSSVPTVAHVRGAVAQLRTLNARPHSDGTYRGIISPKASKQIRASTDFVGWMAYTNRAAMERGKLGVIEDVMFEESSNAILEPVLASNWSGYVSAGDVHGILIFGKGAYGTTKIRGEDAKVNVLTGADKADPHNLHTYISYKFAHASKILNPSAGIILSWLVV